MNSGDPREGVCLNQPKHARWNIHGMKPTGDGMDTYCTVETTGRPEEAQKGTTCAYKRDEKNKIKQNTQHNTNTPSIQLCTTTVVQAPAAFAPATLSRLHHTRTPL